MAMKANTSRQQLERQLAPTAVPRMLQATALSCQIIILDWSTIWHIHTRGCCTMWYGARRGSLACPEDHLELQAAFYSWCNLRWHTGWVYGYPL